MKANKKIIVYVQNKKCGALSENEEGYIFQYDKEYLSHPNAVPISLTFPLQEDAYISNSMFPFFDGLIPEGWLLNIVSKNWKINVNDRFSLLEVTCKDPIGDVHLVKE